MKDPKPVHLKTSETVRSEGWIAEARDSDSHLISVISPDADDEQLGQFMREMVADGLTVTAFPRGLRMTEFQMAMIVAQRFWPGISISEGALEIMEQVRRDSPDQFTAKETEDEPK